MINAQIADLSSHNTKYTSHALTQKVFANKRKVSNGFSRMDTLLFKGMLVPQQVQDDIDDAIEDEEDASKHRGKIVKLDADEYVTLEEVDAEKDADVHGRLEESQAHVYHLALEHA
nr:hypothetical protein [Tanacetum cinerariifolium]